MKIANFKEYIAVLREVYSQDAMGELGNYYRALMQSGAELRKKKALLQKQIYFLNAKIKKQAELIRIAKDKKTAGLEMAEFQKQKCEQISLLKQLQNGDHFNMLGDEAKASVCSGFLLQKYLARELLENNPLNFPTDTNGDLVVNPEKLRSSDIFQEAGHIRDFVTTYLAYHSDKVKTPGHFKTMLNGVKDWAALIAYADNFFENLNDSDYLAEGAIKASRQGAEVVHVFAEQNLQLVRLHNEKALDYESDKMNHCVGKGGYDKGVRSGTTHVYSLRDCSEEGEWLPHATIEYGEGRIKQVKGIANKAVTKEYLPFVRECVKKIMGTDNLDKLNQENKLADLKNWGYLTDVQQRLICIYEETGVIDLKSVAQDDWFLEFIKPEKIRTEAFVITKGMTDETLAFIQRFKDINKLSVSGEDHKDISAGRDFIKKYMGSLELKYIAQKLTPELCQRLGYYFDTGGHLHDMLNLCEEIELDYFGPKESCWKQTNRSKIKLKKLDLLGFVDEVTKTEIKQLKNIEFINNDGEMDGSWTEIRQLLKDILKVTRDEELSSRVTKQEKLGFVSAFTGKRGMIIITKDNKQPETIDLINPGKTASVGDLSLTIKQLEEVDAAHLCCQRLEVQGNISADNINKIAEFARYQDIHFNGANFEKIENLDLSGMTHWGKPLTFDGLMLMSVYSFFLEGYTVSRHLPGKDIIFRNCRNLPPLENITFPAEIQNIMIEPVTGKDYRCQGLDFSKYQELEALQLNNLSLVDNTEVKLPESLTYLAFYNCNLSGLKKIDLSHLPHLKELRLAESNLENIDQFIFPKSMEKTAFGGAIFKPGVDLDLSACENMKHFNLSTWHKSPLAWGNIHFPARIESVFMDGTECPELRELDFSIYENLQSLSLEHSSFPKLKKLVLPKSCERRTNGIITDAEITVTECRKAPVSKEIINNAALLRLKGLRVVEAR